MARAEVISIVALLVSIASLGFSVFFNFRDRARLRTKSTFYPDNQYRSAHISFSVVNAGRRPIVLRMWGGIGTDGEWAGTALGKERSGLRLAEHECFDLSLEKDDLAESTPEDVIEFQDLWVEDSLGRRHAIKDAKPNIQKLRKS
jgi:hypothetical protein